MITVTALKHPTTRKRILDASLYVVRNKLPQIVDNRHNRHYLVLWWDDKAGRIVATHKGKDVTKTVANSL